MQNKSWRAEAPNIFTPSSLPKIHVEQLELKGAAKLYYFPEEEDFYRVMFVFDVGSLDEAKHGINAACAKLILSGSDKRTSREIREEMDRMGAFIEIEPGLHESRISLFCLKNKLEGLLDFFAKVLLEASFPEEELHIFQTQALENFKVNQQKTGFIAKRAFRQTLFGEDSNYGQISSEESIRSWTRQDVLAHYQKFYLQGLKQVLTNALLPKQYLSGFDALYTPQIRSLKNWDGQVREGITTRIAKKNAVQSSLALGYIGVNRHSPHFPKLSFLSTVLGGYFGSRLMKNIREEKGFTYGISSIVHQYPDLGYLAIRTDVKDEVREEALDEIYKEIKRLQDKPIPQQEFDLVRNYLLGSLQRSFDGNLNLLDRFKSCLSFDLETDYYENFVDAILHLNPESLQEFASIEFDPKRFSTVVVGNIDQTL